MVQEKRIHMKDRGCAPGGWYCHCCGPAPKHRKAVVRAIKRSRKSGLNKLVQEEIQGCAEQGSNGT